MLIAVVIAFFVMILAVGAWVSKRARKASDFLIAGRNVNLVLTTATLAAMQIGAGVIMGGSEQGAQGGIWPGMWYGIGCGGGLIIAGLLAAAKLRTRGGFVPLDFFAARYGERRWVRIWAWLSNIPSLLGIFVAQIMAAGAILSIFGVDYRTGVIVVGLVIMIYSAMGGMWGVVIVDFIQLAVVLIGIPLVTIITFAKLKAAGSAAIVLGTPFIPPGMFSKAVFLILPFLLSISVSYDAYMRYQAAKSAKVARWGAILGGLIVIGVSFCTALVGAAGRSLFPEVAAGAVLPHMIRTSLPPILAGVVVSAILAGTMSAANCLLLSLAGTCTRDFYNKVLHPGSGLDDLKHAKLVSRLAIVIALIAGVVIAFGAKGILYTMIIFNYPYMGSMLVPLLGGVLWNGATPKGAMAAIVAGGSVGVIAFLSGLPGPLHGLVNVDLGLLAAYATAAAVLVVVSLATKNDAAAIPPEMTA
ncbi:MAG: sodium:solute symporter family protein [Candidatus Aminicenantales bacterium]